MNYPIDEHEAIKAAIAAYYSDAEDAGLVPMQPANTSVEYEAGPGGWLVSWPDDTPNAAYYVTDLGDAVEVSILHDELGDMPLTQNGEELPETYGDGREARAITHARRRGEELSKFTSRLLHRLEAQEEEAPENDSR